MKNISQRSIDAIRYLGIKSIQQARGGHIGMTISAAPITYTLFTKFINLNPKDGKWINRDRFVLSGGHGSMSMYPIFYLSGLMTLDDLKQFKQENSNTPGHPEYENKPNNFVDASTGPLGQGFAMAVGMALAQKIAQDKTKDKYPNIFTNYTYVVCGDGDLQEGISYEAMAIAGKYQLNKLIVLHDSNRYQLDSSVEEVSIENLRLRCESNNWYYQKVDNKVESIEQAIKNAQNSNLPSFIEVETTIAEGFNVANSNKGHHGVPTDESIAAFKEYFGISFEDWNIDEDIKEHFKQTVSERGQKVFESWKQTFDSYAIQDPTSMEKFVKLLTNKIDYKEIFEKVNISKQNQATRVYLKEYLSVLNKTNPFAIATCADLVSSTNVAIGNETILHGGQNLPVGIREFAMGAIINGFNLYGAFKIIGGTFFVFADYIKSAIRLGAMMELPAIYAFTHDSYLVGGDGPTHEPYDQLPMLRAVEHINVHRPADEQELKYALIESFNSKNTTNILVLTRQNVKSLNVKIPVESLNKNGAYIVKKSIDPDYVIAASGSEVQLALDVASKLKKCQVVSVPCLDKAVKMSSQDKNKLFGAKKALITIEASSDLKWYLIHLTGQKNIHLGAFTFGKSMDGDKLYKDKGFDPEFILKQIKANTK